MESGDGVEVGRVKGWEGRVLLECAMVDVPRGGQLICRVVVRVAQLGIPLDGQSRPWQRGGSHA